MRREPITVTRDQLYDQVWQTPLTHLAAQFGISNVALAKICRKLAVPTPGVGYWARIRNGAKLRRPRLPKPQPDTPHEYTISGGECHAPRKRVAAPTVIVADSLRAAHPVVRKLEATLDDHERADEGLYLRGDSEATARLSKQIKRRALLALDALFKALDARGYPVSLKIPDDRSGEFEIEAQVGSENVRLYIAERLARSDHKMTPDEAAMQKKYGFSLARKYEFRPSGRLTLRARASYMNRTWSDSSKRRLEDLLGNAVVGIEELARRAVDNRAEREEQRRREKEEERREKVSLMLSNYERALGEELEEAAENLRRARAIRELLQAVAAAPIPEAKAGAVRKWLAWAAQWADDLDPLVDCLRTAHIVTPDARKMSDDELEYWCEWPDSAKHAETGYGETFETWSV